MEEDDEIFEDHIDDIELLTANTEKHEVTVRIMLNCFAVFID